MFWGLGGECAPFSHKKSTQKILFTVDQSTKVENTTLTFAKPNIPLASKTLILKKDPTVTSALKGTNRLGC